MHLSFAALGRALLILSGPTLFASAQTQSMNDRTDWTSSLAEPRAIPDLLPGNGYRAGDRLWVYSRLNTGGNQDYYRFLNIMAGTVTIKTTGSTNTVGTLYNDAGDTVLAQNDDRDAGNNDFNFEVSLQLDEMTYYKLRVSGYDAAVTGDYDIIFSSTSMEDYGNGYEESYTTPLGSSDDEYTWDGIYDWAGDKDAFWFYPDVDGTLTVWTDGFVDTVATLYGTDAIRNINYGELGFWDDYVDSNFRFSYDLTAHTEYWLVTGTYGDFTAGAYQITFSWAPGDDPFRDAHDLGELIPGVPGFPGPPIVYNGTLGVGEVHHFKFQNIVAASNILIRSTGNVNVKSASYNLSRSIIASDDNSGHDGFNFRYTISGVAYMTYYVTVEGSTGTETGPYTLVISTDANEDYGNTIASAFEIVDPVNVTLTGALQYNTDIDMFKFVAPGPGQFVVEANNDGGGDSFGYLLDSNGVILATDDDSGPGYHFEIRYTLVEGVTYYVRMNSYYFFMRFPYQLKFTFPNKVLRTTTTRTTSTSILRVTSTSRTTMKASTTTSPDNVPDQTAQEAANNVSGVGGLIGIFVGVISGTMVLGGTVGFFVIRSKFPTIMSMNGATTTTTMTSPYPTVTEKSLNGTTTVASASESAVPPVQAANSSMPQSNPGSNEHTQTIIDVAMISAPTAMQTAATVTEGKMTLEQFAAAIQMPLLVEFAQKSVTLEQLKVMTLNDLVPHGITQEDYLKIRAELKNHGFL